MVTRAALAGRLAPVDRWTLGFVALLSLVLVERWPQLGEAGRPLLVAHLLLVAAPFLAVRARAAGPTGCFLGELYPLILTAALYTEVGLLNRAGGRANDLLVQGWEQALFGGQPSLEWIRAQPWPWLSWGMHLGYLSYYATLSAAALAPWARGRRYYTRRTVVLVMVAFYGCYAIFLAFPVAGPRYSFPEPRGVAKEVLPAVLASRLLERGAAWGTAFPSSHVAAALVASVSAGLAWRGLGLALVPLALVLSLGTVYGQFHYAVDVLGGALVAALVLAAGRPLTRGLSNRLESTL